jgi:hypothetical protein
VREGKHLGSGGGGGVRASATHLEVVADCRQQQSQHIEVFK